MSEELVPAKSGKLLTSTYTDTLDCPWCGSPMADLWELRLTDGDATDVDCGSCGKPFRVEVSVSRHYTGERLVRAGDPEYFPLSPQGGSR